MQWLAIKLTTDLSFKVGDFHSKLFLMALGLCVKSVPKVAAVEFPVHVSRVIELSEAFLPPAQPVAAFQRRKIMVTLPGIKLGLMELLNHPSEQVFLLIAMHYDRKLTSG